MEGLESARAGVERRQADLVRVDLHEGAARTHEHDVGILRAVDGDKEVARGEHLYLIAQVGRRGPGETPGVE